MTLGEYLDTLTADEVMYAEAYMQYKVMPLVMPMPDYNAYGISKRRAQSIIWGLNEYTERNN
jgi:hypothetical protein